MIAGAAGAAGCCIADGAAVNMQTHQLNKRFPSELFNYFN